jgi:hypothetical protein
MREGKGVFIVEGATNSLKNSGHLGYCGGYVRYYLHSGPMGVLYVHVFIQGVF